MGLEEAGLVSWLGFDACFARAQFSGDPALGGAFEVAFHDEVRLVDFFECIGFFAYGDGE